MSLYVVKNDKGEWLYSEEYNDWVDQLSLASFYDTFEDADDDIECWELSNAYVVELVEAPAKVVLTEEQAEIVEVARDATYPASYIYNYTNSHDCDENLLISAYVNGYTLAKEKKYTVRVPLVQAQGGLWFYINSDDKLDATYSQEMAKKFTMDEIEENGLQDCEKEDVTDDE